MPCFFRYLTSALKNPTTTLCLICYCAFAGPHCAPEYKTWLMALSVLSQLETRPGLLAISSDFEAGMYASRISHVVVTAQVSETIGISLHTANACSGLKVYILSEVGWFSRVCPVFRTALKTEAKNLPLMDERSCFADSGPPLFGAVCSSRFSGWQLISQQLDNITIHRFLFSSKVPRMPSCSLCCCDAAALREWTLTSMPVCSFETSLPACCSSKRSCASPWYHALGRISQRQDAVEKFIVY
jgi:hypothetical protein